MGAPSLARSRPALLRAVGWARSLRAHADVVSPIGWVVVAVMVGSWLAGRELGWREMMYVATVAAVMLAIGLIFLVGRTELSVRAQVEPQRVTVGDTATGQLFVTNTSRHRLFALRIELKVGRSAAVFDVPSLPGNGEYDEFVLLPTQRRQIIPIGPARSVRGDPLGLLRRTVDWTEPVPLYVHPKLAALDNLGAGFLRDLEGQPTADLSTNDVAFHTLREYAPGDDSRIVHWKTSARVGKLMVRQFVDTRRSHLAVVLSGEPNEYRDADEFELAVSLAGSLAVRALRDGEAVSVSACGATLPSGNGQLLLDALSGIDMTPGTGLLTQAIEMNRSVPGVSIVALVCGSAVDHRATRSAAARFGENVRVLLVTATTSGVGAITMAGSTTAMNVADLNEFGQQMWKVTNR
jgi:uncharacterized protein (DUF58 family)